MARLGWLEPGESVASIASAGEGNMNLTLRVTTEVRSVILKQSRPWVEKYDHIEAPFDRALVEQRFYRRIESIPEVAASMPELLGADEESRTLLLEDLGAARDLTDLYRGSKLDSETVRALGRYLSALHGSTRGDSPDGLRNFEMRRLNHEHIFRIPFQEANGVPLDDYEPGLSAAAATLRADREILAEIDRLGARYLPDSDPDSGGEDGHSCLVHGDFFPGSWLQTPAGVRVIDPEFGFYGDPELDLGVALGHLTLAKQPFELGLELIEVARAPEPTPVRRRELIARYAGIEILRRLLGVAQLPIAPSVGAGEDGTRGSDSRGAPDRGFRAAMLQRGRAAVLEGRMEALRA